jgi:hypothetical protein
VTGYPLDLIRRYLPRGVVVDSNLLLLLFVGEYDRDLVTSHRRTRAFSVDDYDLLRMILDEFVGVYATPNILTEVSNLAGYGAEEIRERLFDSFRLQIKGLSERYVMSAAIARDPRFSRYGLTDIAICHLAQERNLLVMTDDLPLVGCLRKCGVDAVNFNHIRIAGWK